MPRLPKVVCKLTIFVPLTCTRTFGCLSTRFCGVGADSEAVRSASVPRYRPLPPEEAHSTLTDKPDKHNGRILGNLSLGRDAESDSIGIFLERIEQRLWRVRRRSVPGHITLGSGGATKEAAAALD